jgi:hypothetical protein
MRKQTNKIISEIIFRNKEAYHQKATIGYYIWTDSNNYRFKFEVKPK